MVETKQLTRCKGCGQRAIAKWCPICANVPIDKSYTRKQLSEAFDKVSNKEHWKLPINAVLPEWFSVAETELITAAVIFYTGSVPTFEREYKNGAGSTKVQAAGYYAAVGA